MNIKKYVSKSLKPCFRFKQTGNIWRIFFNGYNILAGETRDIHTKLAYIFSFDHVKQDIFLKDYHPLLADQQTDNAGDGWWFAMDGVNQNYIFISNFIHPEIPEHRGFSAIDIKTGGKKWGNNELQFYFANDNEVFAMKPLFESYITYKLNAFTGDVIDVYKDPEKINSIVELKNLNDISTYTEITNTKIFDVNDPVIKNNFENIISRLLSFKIIGDVEYIRLNNYLIYNYHYNNGINLKDINEQILTNKLEIFDTGTKEIIYKDVLNNETSAYVPDSFFVKNNYLIYIKEKSELVFLKLGN